MPETMKIGLTCSHCEQTKILTVPIEGYASWVAGDLIQDALPNLAPEDRELLISKICGDCWDKFILGE